MRDACRSRDLSRFLHGWGDWVKAKSLPKNLRVARNLGDGGSLARLFRGGVPSGNGGVVDLCVGLDLDGFGQLVADNGDSEKAKGENGEVGLGVLGDEEPAACWGPRLLEEELDVNDVEMLSRN